MIGVRFKILEPMMFRSLGEFSPEARGPYTFARSSPLPTPSTIIGAIASLLYEKSKTVPKSKDWFKELEELVGLRQECQVIGPYLLTRTGEKESVFVWCHDGLINIKDLYDKDFINYLSNIIEHHKSLETLDQLKSFTEISRKINKYIDKCKRMPRTLSKLGVALNDRKTIIERLLYSIEMVDYMKLDEDAGDIFIAVDIIGDLDQDLLSLSGTITRLGGEGRIVKVTVEENISPLVIEDIRSKAESVRDFALYLISPALFRTFKTDLEINEISNQFRTYPNILKVIKQKIQDLTGFEVVTIIGKACVKSAGYKIDLDIKKPIYVSLEPGSIILVSNVDLKIRSISEIAQKIGYGSVLPIPLKT